MAPAPGVTTRDVAIGSRSFGDGGSAVTGGSPGGSSVGDTSECGAGWGSLVESAVALLSPLLAELDPDRLAGGDAVSLYASFVALDRLVMAGKTLLAPRIDTSGVWQHRGHRNAASLLAEVEGVAPGQAQSLLEVGRRLGQLPGTREAVRQGTLSGPKVVQLTGAGILDPAREPDLLEGAASEPLHLVRERCGRSKATSRAHDPIATLRRIRAARFFSSWTDAEGAFCYQGKDTADRGAQILSQVGATASRLRRERRHRSDEAAEPERAVRADAFFALLTGVHPDGPVLSGGPGRAERSVGTQRTRGSGTSRSAGPPGDSATLATLAGALDPNDDPDLDPDGLPDDSSPDDSEAPGGHDSFVDQPSADSLTIIDRPPTCTVMVRVDLDALRRGSVGEGGICEIPGVGPVSVQVARELMGDALCDLVITDGVDVTTVCRLGRSVPTALATAITERDQHCVVPGCGVALGLERDHWQVDFAKGGVVSMDNLARLCKHHHKLKTHHGFALAGGPGRWEWIPPDTPKVATRKKKKTGRRPPPPNQTGPPDPPNDPPLFDLKE